MGFHCFFCNTLIHIYIYDATQDGTRGMNSEVYRIILYATLAGNASKLIRRIFLDAAGQWNKHTATKTKYFIKKKKWTVLNCPSKSLDSFHLKRRLNDAIPEQKIPALCHVNLCQNMTMKTARVCLYQLVAGLT